MPGCKGGTAVLAPIVGTSRRTQPSTTISAPKFFQGPLQKYPFFRCRLTELGTVFSWSIAEGGKVSFMEVGIDWLQYEANTLVLISGPAKLLWLLIFC